MTSFLVDSAARRHAVRTAAAAKFGFTYERGAIWTSNPFLRAEQSWRSDRWVVTFGRKSVSFKNLSDAVERMAAVMAAAEWL